MLSSIVCFVFLTGCNEQSIEVPESGEPMLLITHVKEPTLSFFDTNSDEDVGSTTLPYTMTDMTYISDQTMVGLNSNEQSILEIDLEQEVARPFMELESGMTNLTYDTNSDQLFLSSNSSHEVHVVDVSSKEELTPITVDSIPNELSLNDQGLLFVLMTDTNEVSMIDIQRGEVVRTFPVNDTPVGMHFDGQWLWVGGHGSNTELNRSVYAYDPQTGENVMTVDVGLMPIAMVGSENSEELFVLCHGDHSLYKSKY
ncbi:YncE family protein [Alkalicoccobacillus plakortidis]|uniref:YVTN family beta-propeller protein n=1 Tax=Alkalicoccobacillus plakortidis TaxID=444060 RepID=A0ABT0XDZ4_9BACI|nr:hypothetical protein [Alkalicoccobacillus plakortidis]MCM2674121.1 hypothetical protein [Alkalicoccobacillus plakortidis]